VTREASELFSRVEKQRIAVVQRVLWVLFAISGVTLLAIVLGSSGAPWRETPFWVNLIALPVLGAALWLNHRNRFAFAVSIVMVVLVLAGTAPLMLGGLDGSPLSLLILAVPIVLAGLVLTRRALVVVTAWSVGVVALTTALEARGLLPSAGGPDLNLAVQAVVLLLLIAFFLDRFGLVFRATLTDALDYQVRLKEQANDRLRTQAALLEQKSLTEAMIENTPGLFALIGHDGRLSRWNRSLQRVLGHTESDLEGLASTDLAAPEDRPAFADLLREILERGVGSGEVRLATRDGRKVPFIIHGARLTLAGEDFIIGMGLDRSEVAAARSRIESLDSELQERLEHITALHEIDRAITGSLDLGLTLDVILLQVTRRLHVDAASVLLFDPSRNMLVFGASRGFHGKVLRSTALNLGEGLAGKAAIDRSRVVVVGADELSASFPPDSKVQAEGFESYVATPLVAKGRLQGVLELFHRSELEPDDDWHDFLTTLATQAAIALDNATLFESLERSNLELRLAYDRTIEGWARALDLRDEETEGHSRRVTDMTVRLAERMGMPSEELVHVRRGALLHDIGKMGVPDRILLKPAKLDPDEWEIMKKHPTYAVDLLSPIEFLRPALDIPYAHHERWDGNGYPRGLSGERIPLAARIFAVVDVYDALTSDRPYRAAWPPEKALQYIREQSGQHFDPRVVDEFLEMIAQG
jgi:PAS domain S-box-containing protein